MAVSSGCIFSVGWIANTRSPWIGRPASFLKPGLATDIGRAFLKYIMFLGRGIRRRTVHTLAGPCVQKSENITLYNYIPLSQVKNKNIILVIFVISQNNSNFSL